MRRAGRIALYVAGAVILLPIVLVLGVLLAANTGPGQRLIERQIRSLTGGQVVLAGLAGRLPDELRLAHLQLRDRAGTWLSADGIMLRWSPTALLGGTARIDALSATALSMERLPLPAQPAPPAASSGSGFRLPVQVDLRSLAVARLALGQALAGSAAVLRVDGRAHLASLTAGNVTLRAVRLDAPGTYQVMATLAPGSITASLALHEPAGGLLANLAQLPALGALDAAANITGPQTAEHVQITASAGPLRLDLHGHANIPGQSGTLDLVAASPAMQPAPGIAWRSLDVAAHVAGPLLAPVVRAHATLADVQGGGAAIGALTATMDGTRGRVSLAATLAGTRLPGPRPDMFAASPIAVNAAIDLQAPGQPATFTLSHALLTLAGSARVAGARSLGLRLTVPDLAPLAALGGISAQGPLTLNAQAAQQGGVIAVRLDGQGQISAGQAPLPALLGPTRFAAAGSVHGQDLTLTSLTLTGRAVSLGASGTDMAGALDGTGHVALPDLAALSPQARGVLTAALHVTGKPTSLSATATIAGKAGSSGFAPAPVTMSLQATGLPSAPNADIDAHGTLLGAPFAVVAQARSGADGSLSATLQRADWKSLTARAALTRAKGATVPVGKLTLRVARLADIAALSGLDLTGALSATLASQADRATVQLRGSQLATGGRAIGRLALDGTATGLTATPDLAATLTLDDIAANGITGQARLTATGRQTALRLDATAALHNVQGADARLRAAAVLNGTARQLALSQLDADWKSLALRLQAPARIDFGSRIALDHLALGLNQASLRLAGQISPALDVTAALRNVTPDLARAVAPNLNAAGMLTADARLTGTAAAPQGRVHLAASGVHLRSGPAASLPPAALVATAVLHGQSAQLDARVTAGPRLHLAASGTVPLHAGGPLAVRGAGAVDMALLNPILEAAGRRVSGQAAFDISAGGAMAAPRISGSATLAQGEIDDYAQGLQLTRLGARIDAVGDTLRLTRLHAKAGAGTIDVAGSLGVFAPGIPVDLHLTAHQAKPLASDLLTAVFDADLTVRGSVSAGLLAAGTVDLRRVDINIPQSLPPGIAVLNVRRPGDKPPPPVPAPAAPPAVVRLAVTVDAARNIFVRGDGLDAELGGKLTIAGTSTAPQIAGGFDLRRGDFSLAGTTLTFSKGTVGFNGASASGRIDPTLDFEADSVANGITATLAVTGYADQPKISLSSTPPLPQDEVLAQLLFGTSVTKLSPLQIAEIGAALAELSGVTGTGGPLSSIRKGLGLDRLSVGGGTNGAGATVEAGRYVANGVYVGAKQSAGGAGGTQAQVQVDLTRHLKLQTTLGTGGGSVQGATPQNDPGSSVGLSYQFEY